MDLVWSYGICIIWNGFKKLRSQSHVFLFHLCCVLNTRIPSTSKTHPQIINFEHLIHVFHVCLQSLLMNIGLVTPVSRKTNLPLEGALLGFFSCGNCAVWCWHTQVWQVSPSHCWIHSSCLVPWSKLILVATNVIYCDLFYFGVMCFAC